MAAIGIKIKKRRQVLGLTQGELAGRLGVSKSTVANWERGKHFPLRHLGAVEAALGISLEESEERSPLDDLKPWRNHGEAVVAEDPDIPDDLKRRMITDWRRVHAESRRRGRSGAPAMGAV